ncbi:hypothetical protein NA57DRAFT_58533 [Rhizodiscina lignyota]|uniref:Uncharacterized protein n=1 Tax=Rhizodiscina lignyota TaxID=1504668 RepID=A0A9P4IC96_9PEZI|nr:hypothetical protein NA57DRAFT_58533 [Rhizodiscina lignyota]
MESPKRPSAESTPVIDLTTNESRERSLVFSNPLRRKRVIAVTASEIEEILARRSECDSQATSISRTWFDGEDSVPQTSGYRRRGSTPTTSSKSSMNANADLLYKPYSGGLFHMIPISKSRKELYFNCLQYPPKDIWAPSLDCMSTCRCAFGGSIHRDTLRRVCRQLEWETDYHIYSFAGEYDMERWFGVHCRSDQRRMKAHDRANIQALYINFLVKRRVFELFNNLKVVYIPEMMHNEACHHGSAICSGYPWSGLSEHSRTGVHAHSDRGSGPFVYERQDSKQTSSFRDKRGESWAGLKHRQRRMGGNMFGDTKRPCQVRDDWYIVHNCTKPAAYFRLALREQRVHRSRMKVLCKDGDESQQA